MATTECHPDRKHHAKGLCYSCYVKVWRRQHPGAQARHSRRFRERHPDAQRVYYEANRDRILARNLSRYRAHPEVGRGRVAAKHGLTLVERDRLLSVPCAICGAVATDIDHDHATGAVRGALCGPCNSGIGMLRDDPELVARAATYLATHRPLRSVS